MSVVVTGATGTIGSELVRQLAAKGIKVRAVVHSAAKAKSLKWPPQVEILEADITRPGSLKTALAGAEKLFLLTPTTDKVVEITNLIVQQAKAAGVKQIVRLSAYGADVASPNPLLKWHGESEKVIRNSGIAYTILRPGIFMQNLVNFMGKAIKEQNAIYSPAGEGKMSFVDARDIAAVAVSVLTGKGHESKIYLITGGEAISYGQVATILSKVTGRKIQYTSVPDEKAAEGMRGMGMPEWLVEGMLGLNRATREGKMSSIANTIFDLTGRKPTTFETFAKDNAPAFK